MWLVRDFAVIEYPLVRRIRPAVFILRALPSAFLKDDDRAQNLRIRMSMGETISEMIHTNARASAPTMEPTIGPVILCLPLDEDRAPTVAAGDSDSAVTGGKVVLRLA